MKVDIYLLATRRYQHEINPLHATNRNDQTKELNKNSKIDVK